MSSEIWTIKRLLDWCVNYFTQKQISSPRLDAELLLAHTLGIQRLDLYLKFDQPVSPQELQVFKSLLKRRGEDEPAAYILGFKEFWSKKFLVTPDVLIPRPDTEILIEVILQENTQHHFSQAIEIGVGSGAISIILATEIESLHITGIDISPTAIAIAKQNAECHHTNERVLFIQEDFFNFVPQQKFDLIVSNPPYVTKKEMQKLPNTVKKYEPSLALDGGEDGLNFYRKIGPFSFEFLTDNGCVFLEIGETQAEQVVNILKNAGLTDIRVKKDYAGQDRVVSAKKTTLSK